VITAQQVHQEGQFVLFRLAEESYAIPISTVQEIILLDRATRLPEMPDFVEGIIDLRGRIIPVINLRRRFGLPPESTQCANRTLVAEIGELEVGLLVDDVTGVVRLSADSIQRPPDMLSVRASAVDGVACVAGRLVLLLNPHLVLMPREQELLQARALTLSGTEERLLPPDIAPSHGDWER